MPSSILRTGLGAAAVALVCAFATGCEPDPISDQATLVSTYNGKAVVNAFAHTFGDRTNLKAGILGNYKDPLADGNGVHVKLDGYYYNDASNSSVWNTIWTTPRIGTADGEKPFSDVHSIFNAPGYVYYTVYACAQMGFPIPDSCTQRDVKSAF